MTGVELPLSQLPDELAAVIREKAGDKEPESVIAWVEVTRVNGGHQHAMEEGSHFGPEGKQMPGYYRAPSASSWDNGVLYREPEQKALEAVPLTAK